ncbi:thioredoxin domain-containing protein [Litoribrevibacter albus]|uniref:Thioredoxin-like fold domain-containing protein n=1 Tax=Litoribrevibacter albus TaxID=1473156 RepID=A0AA37SC09_9GAMM|nr:thioredoxin domain-containing protein [Litoribrevibacter albus]GLQ32649.1 hypothetical protein GCM10007876_31280 [Litoribrevibacter albus]
MTLKASFNSLSDSLCFASAITPLLLTVLITSGCQETETSAPPHGSQSTVYDSAPQTHGTSIGVSTPSPSKTIARVNGYPIELSEVDQKIRFELHDLNWQAYQLRQAALNKLVQKQADTGSQTQAQSKQQAIENLLTPPIPPVTELPKSSVSAKGQIHAPLSVAVFCSFQSPHCKRMQPVYQALAQQLGDQIRFEHFDYPLSFHRNARPAANAARCANSYGKFWEYSDALYAHQDDLTPERFLSIATQLHINTPEFKACLENLEYREYVEQDVTFGESLGLSNVPITFINGLYIKGPALLSTLNFYSQYALSQVADQALSKDQKRDKQQQIEKSQLPLRLVAINLASDAEHSTAVIELIDDESQALFRNNQPIQFSDYFSEPPILVTIEAQRVLIKHQGVLSFLSLTAPSSDTASNAQNTTQKATAVTSTGTFNEDQQTNQDSLELYPERRFNEGNRELPVTTLTPLSREWLDEQLMNQSQLEEHFQPASHKVEGQSLLKLSDVQQQEFYQTLGLQEGDVVLRVNDAWVYDGQNTLWETLDQEKDVTIQLIRHGLPVRYDYSVQ